MAKTVNNQAQVSVWLNRTSCDREPGEAQENIKRLGHNPNTGLTVLKSTDIKMTQSS